MEQRTLIYAKEITDENLFRDIFFSKKIKGDISILQSETIDDQTLKETLLKFIIKIIAEEKFIFSTKKTQENAKNILAEEFSMLYTKIIDIIKRCAKEYAND